MSDMEKETIKFKIEIPEGTVVKMEGRPVILKKSLDIEDVDNTIFDINMHEVMEKEEDT